MIADKELTFHDTTATVLNADGDAIGGGDDLTLATGSVNGTNDYDIGPLHADNLSLDINWGTGEPLYFYWIIVGAADVDSATNTATLQIQLVSDAVADGQDGSSTVHVDTGAIAEASLVLGARGFHPLPERSIDGTAGWERYVGVWLTVGGENITSDTHIQYGITRSTSRIATYASGLTHA